MKKTEKYGLNIIEGADKIDFEVLNENTNRIEELIRSNSDDISAIEEIVADEFENVNEKFESINKKLKNVEIKIVEETASFDGYVVGEYYKVKNTSETAVEVTDTFDTTTLAPGEEYTVDVESEFHLEISATESVELTYFQAVKRYVDERTNTDVYTKNQVDALLNFKVNVEQGKSLSSNDFTNEEKEKLASLENYDDTEIREKIESRIQTPQVAEVGQVLAVKAVDSDGKPTEWECVEKNDGKKDFNPIFPKRYEAVDSFTSEVKNGFIITNYDKSQPFDIIAEKVFYENSSSKGSISFSNTAMNGFDLTITVKYPYTSSVSPTLSQTTAVNKTTTYGGGTITRIGSFKMCTWNVKGEGLCQFKIRDNNDSSTITWSDIKAAAISEIHIDQDSPDGVLAPIPGVYQCGQKIDVFDVLSEGVYVGKENRLDTYMKARIDINTNYDYSTFELNRDEYQIIYKDTLLSNSTTSPSMLCIKYVPKSQITDLGLWVRG